MCARWPTHPGHSQNWTGRPRFVILLCVWTHRTFTLLVQYHQRLLPLLGQSIYLQNRDDSDLNILAQRLALAILTYPSSKARRGGQWFSQRTRPLYSSIVCFSTPYSYIISSILELTIAWSSMPKKTRTATDSSVLLRQILVEALGVAIRATLCMWRTIAGVVPLIFPIRE